MAVSDKNILITPNISGILGNQPSVVFTGADSSIGDSAAITATANPENSGTLNFSASEGQLFSISNNLTDGDIFTVNDVSGIPSLAIGANGIVKIAEYSGRILLGGATDDSTSLLQLNGHMQLSDNSEIRLGNDSDLKIYHNGSNSLIQNSGTGAVIHMSDVHSFRNAANTEQLAMFVANGKVELYHNDVLRLETTDSGATVTGNLTADGVNLGDGEFISIGASTDLRLRSNGTHGYVEHTSGTGSLIFKGNNLSFRNGADNAQLAVMTNGGSVELYENNVKKLETTAYGATVTGTMNADSADIVGQLTAGVLEGEGGATYDPPGTSGSETSTAVGLALHSGKRIVLGHDGYIRTIVDATASQPLKFGQSGTGYFAGTEVYGGSQGVKLK